MNTSEERNFEKYYNYSLRFLSYRPRSEKEIRDRLKIKNGERIDSIIDSVIHKLKEQNFLNDEEFAKWWIEQRTTFRPKGLRVIKMELKQKGISNEVIDFVISNSKFPISNESERARKLIEKKMEQLKDLPRQEVYRKVGSFLARRGFDIDTINSVIDEFYKKGV